MYEYFHDMLRFGAFYRKMALKQVILGIASGRCNFHSSNSNLATNDFYKDIYDYQMFCVSVKCL